LNSFEKSYWEGRERKVQGEKLVEGNSIENDSYEQAIGILFVLILALNEFFFIDIFFSFGEKEIKGFFSNKKIFFYCKEIFKQVKSF